MKIISAKMMRKIFSNLVLILFAFQANSMDVNAQLIVSASNNLQTNLYYSVRKYSEAIPELQKRITIQEKAVLLDAVLREIAKKANLGIAFNSDLGILKKEIDIDVKNTTVSETLRLVLMGTGYEAAVSKTREILLIKSELELTVAENNAVKEIKGTVTDATTNEPLPAASVVVKGTNVGTSTDYDGTFKLNIPDDAEILVISFIGYKTLEVPIGDRMVFNIQLEPDLLVSLEDVVVVGYGTQRRTEVTGAVTSIRAEELQNVPVSSFENALQGKLAGVNVAESSGEPGASTQIIIRGTGSISAGNDPLYVVDGVPISNNANLQVGVNSQRASFQPPKSNPMATINPKDIESIEVLKDASAAAIYGSRGSNGVILITTKKGMAGPPKVTYGTYIGFQSVINEPDLMNAQELIEYTQDARNNNYLETADPLNPASPNYNPLYDPTTNAGRPNTDNFLIPEKYVNWDGTDTDWLDLVLSTAVLQNHNVSVSGGSETSTYYFSAGYLNQEGIIEGSEFDRYTLSTNLTNKITSQFKIGMGINASRTDHDRVPASSPYFGTPPGIIYSAMVQSPVISPYNADGTINQRDNQSYLGGGTTSASNPLAIMEYIEENLKSDRVYGNVYGEYSFTDNFYFKTLVGYDINNYQQSYYQGTEFLYRDNPEGQPYGQTSSSNSFNWLWENTLNYSATIGTDHKINAVVGYTAQKEKNEYSYIISQKFSDDQIKTIGGGIISGGDQQKEEWSIASALARVNYVFKDRYLFTGTLRSDRSSRFGKDHQTGLFPSASLGWRVTEESFMQELDFVNEFKLRGSYGVTGNFLIPNYGAIGLLGEGNYIQNGTEVNGVIPTTMGDDELSWETTYQTDLGFDYAFLNDRIYGSFDYYSSTTKDLLLNVPVPASTGFQTVLTNIGEVENKGFEFFITTRNLVGDFQWSTDFNIASNKNKVTKLGPEGEPILSGGAAGQRHITMIGEEIGSYYGYVVEGIYQNEAEIAAAPHDALASDPHPGDFRFKDVNGDGQITPDDRTILGSYHPDFTYGITNRFNWKNFDISIFIQGVAGREILNLTSRHLLNGEANFNSYAELNDRWRSESDPGSGDNPRADRNSAPHGNNNRESSYQVQDGSYVKIKNLALGYSLPGTLIKNYLSKARVYVSVTNLAIYTDYIGFNPEVSLQAGNSYTPGEDYGAYPLSRTIQFGIDIEF